MATRAKEGHERRKTCLINELPEEMPPQSPLDFALAVMRDDAQSDALRAGMAKAVLPYLHKRGEEEGDATKSEPKYEPMSDLELARRVAFILKLGERQLDGEAAARSGEEPVASAAPHSSPAPPANEQPSLTPCAPLPPDDERVQRDDQPDPHAAYRWIP